MAHRLLRDPDADGWERSDFPILCETCLGPNPYVRMSKENFGRECKICTRPFTVFRWRPGSDARYKKTEICQTCTKMKNVCQVCLLDLEYGLPVQARDAVAGVESTEMAKSDVNREYQAELMDQKALEGIDFGAQHGYGKAGKGKDMLLRMQRTTPYYKRNRAHICSFFVKGECTRGAECPYRHEMPDTGPLAEQNLKDRYYGVNDPVAEKLLARAKEAPTLLTPPEDTSIMTLYVGGLDNTITEDDLRDAFYAYGEIVSVKIISTRLCAFVTYTTRAAAEKAAETLVSRLVIKGVRCKLMWGKPAKTQPQLQQQQHTGEAGGAAASAPSSAPSSTAGGSAPGGPGLVAATNVPPPSMFPPQVASQMPRGPPGVPHPMRGGGGGGGGGPPMNFFNLPSSQQQQQQGGMMAAGGGGVGRGPPLMPPPHMMPPPFMGMMPPPGPMAPPPRSYYPSMDPNAMGSNKK